MTELGWTTALADAGIPIGYLDLNTIMHKWFADEVRAIRINPGGPIAVFSRGIRPTPPLNVAAVSTAVDDANDRFQQAVDRDDAARLLRSLPRTVLLGVADLNYVG